MVIFEKEAKEALESMKKVLEKIDERLNNEEDLLGDVNENERLRNKKIWVEKEINYWENFINQ